MENFNSTLYENYILSSPNIIDKKDGNQILKTIFALDSSQNNKLLPILEDLSKIKRSL